MQTEIVSGASSTFKVELLIGLVLSQCCYCTLFQAVRNLVFLLISLAINTFPVLYIICYNLWQDTPSYTDLIGQYMYSIQFMSAPGQKNKIEININIYCIIEDSPRYLV